MEGEDTALVIIMFQSRLARFLIHKISKVAAHSLQAVFLAEPYKRKPSMRLLILYYGKGASMLASHITADTTGAFSIMIVKIFLIVDYSEIIRSDLSHL